MVCRRRPGRVPDQPRQGRDLGAPDSVLTSSSSLLVQLFHDRTSVPLSRAPIVRVDSDGASVVADLRAGAAALSPEAGRVLADGVLPRLAGGPAVVLCPPAGRGEDRPDPATETQAADLPDLGSVLGSMQSLAKGIPDAGFVKHLGADAQRRPDARGFGPARICCSAATWMPASSKARGRPSSSCRVCSSRATTAIGLDQLERFFDLFARCNPGGMRPRTRRRSPTFWPAFVCVPADLLEKPYAALRAYWILSPMSCRKDPSSRRGAAHLRAACDSGPTPMRISRLRISIGPGWRRASTPSCSC